MRVLLTLIALAACLMTFSTSNVLGLQEPTELIAKIKQAQDQNAIIEGLNGLHSMMGPTSRIVPSQVAYTDLVSRFVTLLEHESDKIKETVVRILAYIGEKNSHQLYQLDVGKPLMNVLVSTEDFLIKSDVLRLLRYFVKLGARERDTLIEQGLIDSLFKVSQIGRSGYSEMNHLARLILEMLSMNEPMNVDTQMSLLPVLKNVVKSRDESVNAVWVDCVEKLITRGPEQMLDALYHEGIVLYLVKLPLISLKHSYYNIQETRETAIRLIKTIISRNPYWMDKMMKLGMLGKIREMVERRDDELASAFSLLSEFIEYDCKVAQLASDVNFLNSLRKVFRSYNYTESGRMCVLAVSRIVQCGNPDQINYILLSGLIATLEEAKKQFSANDSNLDAILSANYTCTTAETIANIRQDRDEQLLNKALDTIHKDLDSFEKSSAMQKIKNANLWPRLDELFEHGSDEIKRKVMPSLLIYAVETNSRRNRYLELALKVAAAELSAHHENSLTIQKLFEFILQSLIIPGQPDPGILNSDVYYTLPDETRRSLLDVVRNILSRSRNEVILRNGIAILKHPSLYYSEIEPVQRYPIDRSKALVLTKSIVSKFSRLNDAALGLVAKFVKDDCESVPDVIAVDFGPQLLDALTNPTMSALVKNTALIILGRVAECADRKKVRSLVNSDMRSALKNIESAGAPEYYREKALRKSGGVFEG